MQEYVAGAWNACGLLNSSKTLLVESVSITQVKPYSRDAETKCEMVHRSFCAFCKMSVDTTKVEQAGNFWGSYLSAVPLRRPQLRHVWASYLQHCNSTAFPTAWPRCGLTHKFAPPYRHWLFNFANLKFSEETVHYSLGGELCRCHSLMLYISFV